MKVIYEVSGKDYEFYTELKELINKHCRENGSDTPDHVLASYLMGCLAQFDETTRLRDGWYDFRPWPEKWELNE